ncbi:PEP-CTERM sorting domain-containing protein [uncultured Rhodoblastus sp.]|uniref:PEP-CTERM sorting domain-containing protein n=1 Tax=uncultured Rhodoblastus sp. TaxID=543037 RepID=UPI0025E3845F|nr:PEP-CTERM sorting domain-containing protein [uncultured Rhodoblastus sp.]
MKFLVDDQSKAASSALMASIHESGQLSYPLEIAMTVYGNRSILSDRAYFIMQEYSAGAADECNPVSDDGWTGIYQIENAVSFGLQSYVGPDVNTDNMPIMAMQKGQPIDDLDAGNLSVKTENNKFEYANKNFCDPGLTEAAAAGFCPWSRPWAALECSAPDFAPRCGPAMTSRRDVCGEEETADFCETRLACESPCEGRFAEAAAAGFCPWTREWAAVESNQTDFAPRCGPAMTSRLDVCGEEATADLCESRLACESPSEGRFIEAAADGFCPWSREWAALEFSTPDFAPRCGPAMTSRLEVCGEEATADFCESRLACESLCEGRFTEAAAAGFCPWSREWAALESNQTDFAPRCGRAMTSRLEVCGEAAAADLCETRLACESPYEGRFTEAAAAGSCPWSRPWAALESNSTAIDQRIAALTAGSPCHRTCAIVFTSPNVASVDHANNDRPATSTPGNNPNSATLPLLDFGFIDLGYLGPKTIAFGSNAWNWVETASNSKSCTMNAAKVYSRLELHFDTASPAPEPSTWALMLLGLVALGCASRRGRAVLRAHDVSAVGAQGFELGDCRRR